MCVKAIECPYDGENQQKKQHSYIYIWISCVCYTEIEQTKQKQTKQICSVLLVDTCVRLFSQFAPRVCFIYAGQSQRV